MFEQYFGRNPIKQAIFIWGVPRSGTTLLYQLLSKHPEVGFLTNSDGSPREGTSFWWQAFGEHRGVMDETITHSKEVRQIRHQYAVLLKQQGKGCLLDKIPFMILWIPLVNKVFGEARHLHIIRDGRAVVNSILFKLRYSERKRDREFRDGKKLFGPHPPELIDPMRLPPVQRHTRQWMLLIEHGQRNAKLLGKRYYELRYEDLVSNPRAVMKVVFDHTRLKYDDLFVNVTYPESMENRNQKWQAEKNRQWTTGYTCHCALNHDDLAYFREMEPMLHSLGYSTQQDERFANES